ncbi:hypothetical protein [Brachybacterium sp. GPGPB12]|uniref:vWA domain-containing protein n=1 Tax=Brachybacterium sp. GPGPB12 TaxID=3023517 RepID=UPI00313444E8
MRPSGYTPIGLSLTKAAAELPEAEMRSIVLVSDGIDECGGPPPCEVAADLAQKHPEMRIHTIGFKAEQDARDELACIAEATGGTFADATDAETLRDEPLVKMTRAIQGYATQGRPITGGTSPETAVDLAPGSFLDVLEHGGRRDRRRRGLLPLLPPAARRGRDRAPHRDDGAARRGRGRQRPRPAAPGHQLRRRARLPHRRGPGPRGGRPRPGADHRGRRDPAPGGDREPHLLRGGRRRHGDPRGRAHR